MHHFVFYLILVIPKYEFQNMTGNMTESGSGNMTGNISGLNWG
jgi:hypothetical protein